MTQVRAPDGQLYDLSIARRGKETDNQNSNQIDRHKENDSTESNRLNTSRIQDENQKSASKSTVDKRYIVISACDGMSGAALSLKKHRSTKRIKRFIAIETDPIVKKIAQFANPPTEEFVGIDHSFCRNLWFMTEEKIKSLGRDVIGLFTKDVAAEFKRFLDDHIPHVKDRRAFEQKLTKVKPDGEKGAFGEEFEKVAGDFGYIMDPSLPRQPWENTAETAVNEAKRKALTLIEANALPTKYFTLALRYISQMANLMPCTGHDNYQSAYQYVTGETPHIDELIPLPTLLGNSQNG